MSRPRRSGRRGPGGGRSREGAAGERTVAQRGYSILRRAPIIFIVLALAFPAWTTVRADRIDDARDLVRALASVGGVAGHEGPVRAAIRRAAPTWVSFQADNLG